MTTTATPSYDALTATWLRLYRLGHLQSIASWDQAANMPPKGNTARGQALAEIAMLLHGMRTDPALKNHLARAEDEALSDAAARQPARDRARLVPRQRAAGRTGGAPRAGHLALRVRLAHAAPGQRLGGLRRPTSKTVLDVGREEARHLAEQSGLSPYDALIDRFEPGMRGAHDRPHLRRRASSGCRA